MDIDVIFGSTGADEIHGYNGGLLSVGDPNNPTFELLLGNLIFGGDQNDTIYTQDGIDVIFCGNDDDTATAGSGDNLTIDSSFRPGARRSHLRPRRQRHPARR
jgi:Ca2+-binding RTX toxin-like protein